MSGPPGTGKSMLAQRMPGIMPPMSDAEALTTAAIFSLREQVSPTWQTRPFRTPHHSATAIALTGGCADPRPGEISMAHNGVLFLDELPEFNRRALEMLREPLETGCITIARARKTLSFPARFQLVAAMNPCPCGYHGDSKHECRCTRDQIRRYQSRISAPLLDRIDIRVELSRERLLLNATENQSETSSMVGKRVIQAISQRDIRNGKPNAWLNAAETRRWCWPGDDGLKLLERAAVRLDLSRRACDRTMRVARTIADLAISTSVTRSHIAEALSLLGRTTN